MGFEENIKALSEIVGQLEKGELTLEKSVELYGKGVKLAELCRKELESSKTKITLMGETENGKESRTEA